MDITAALAVRLRLRAAARLAARQAVELCIQAAGIKFLAALDLLASFPPLPFLGALGKGLRAGLRLRRLRTFALIGRF